jgi:uncharacterized membrane protein YdbT with pleckstrin-like domain
VSLTVIEENLVGSEQIAYRGHIHVVTYTPALAAVLASLSCFSIGAEMRTWLPVLEYAGLIFLFVAICFALVAYIRIRTSEFAVTNRRVIVQIGYLRRTSLEIFLAKIEGISINQSVIGRILNFGDISIRGGGGIQEDFQTVAAPYRFRRHVELLADAMANKG